MPETEQVIQVVREWVVKAENDLKNASNTLKMGIDCPKEHFRHPGKVEHTKRIKTKRAKSQPLTLDKKRSSGNRLA